MLKEAINRILELAAPNISNIHGDTYCDKKMNRIDYDLRADELHMCTLSSLVDYVKNGKSDFKDCRYIIQVSSPTEVRLLSGLDNDRMRETLAVVEAEIPDFPFGRFIENEQFIINMQSKFVDTGDKKAILAFAGNVKAGTVEKYGDDGVSQKAAVKRGVTSLSEVEVPSPCVLAPYRTFTEVPQPAGSFIFRVRDDERCGVSCALFEADGGAWKNEAKAGIRAYLEERLGDMENIMIIS